MSTETTRATTAARRRLWDNGGETTATRRQRQDDGRRTTAGRMTAARQQWQWRRKKPAADLVISTLFIYICVRFLVIFAVLPLYLFPAVLFYLFIFSRKFFYFWRVRGHVSFLTCFHVSGQKLTWKIKNLIYSRSVTFKEYFNPMLNFEFIKFFSRIPFAFSVQSFTIGGL